MARTSLTVAPAEPDATFRRGEHVEALCPVTRRWRPGYCAAYRPYRGQEGWDVVWTDLAPDAPYWESRGGWQYMATIRKAEA